MPSLHAQYDQHASAQTHSANHLFQLALTYCPPTHESPKKILDIGCGYGTHTTHLATLYPLAKLTGIDPDSNRLNTALLTQGLSQNPKVQFMGHSLATHQGTYDLVFSNASLHWAETLSPLPTLIHPNGYAVFSYYTNRTFYELTSVLDAVFPNPPRISAHRFTPVDEIITQLSPKLTLLHHTQDILTLTFKSALDLLKHIKYTGTRGTPISKNTILWTPSTLKKIESEFLTQYGQLQLTYCIHYTVWIRP